MGVGVGLGVGVGVGLNLAVGVSVGASIGTEISMGECSESVPHAVTVTESNIAARRTARQQ